MESFVDSEIRIPRLSVGLPRLTSKKTRPKLGIQKTTSVLNLLYRLGQLDRYAEGRRNLPCLISSMIHVAHSWHRSTESVSNSPSIEYFASTLPPDEPTPPHSNAMSSSSGDSADRLHISQRTTVHSRRVTTSRSRSSYFRITKNCTGAANAGVFAWSAQPSRPGDCWRSSYSKCPCEPMTIRFIGLAARVLVSPELLTGYYRPDNHSELNRTPVVTKPRQAKRNRTAIRSLRNAQPVDGFPLATLRRTP